MPNPGFETDLSSWTLHSSFSPPTTASQSNAWSTEGLYSMDLIEQSPGAGVNTDTATTVFPLDGSAAYAFHTDINAVAINWYAVSQVEVLVENSSTFAYTRTDFQIRDGGVWNFDGVFSGAGMDTASIAVMPSCYTTSCVTELMVDNVRMQGLQNLIPNGNFQTSDLSAWHATGGATLTWVADSVGGHLAMTGSTTGAAIVTVDLPVSPCTEYAFFAKTQVNQGFNIYPQRTWLDSAGNTLPSDTADGSWLVPPAGAAKLLVEFDESGTYSVNITSAVLVGR